MHPIKLCAVQTARTTPSTRQVVRPRALLERAPLSGQELEFEAAHEAPQDVVHVRHATHLRHAPEVVVCHLIPVTKQCSPHHRNNLDIAIGDQRTNLLEQR